MLTWRGLLAALHLANIRRFVWSAAGDVVPAPFGLTYAALLAQALAESGGGGS